MLKVNIARYYSQTSFYHGSSPSWIIMLLCSAFPTYTASRLVNQRPANLADKRGHRGDELQDTRMFAAEPIEDDIEFP